MSRTGRQTDALGRVWLWLFFWLVIAAAVLGGVMCATPARRVSAPEDAAPEDIERAIRELEERLDGLEEFTREAVELRRTVKSLCEQSPTAEGCPDAQNKNDS